MSAAIMATRNAIENLEPWQKEVLGAIFAIGFLIGAGFTLWIKYTLIMQGVLKPTF